MKDRVCALCKEKKADKKNTHYLTDSLFRSIGGDGKREFGSYYDISNNTVAMRYIFQRNTPYEKIVESLGREPKSQEIEDAKRNPFSVNDVFCVNCERLFSKIEDQFTKLVLPIIENHALLHDDSIELDESRMMRLFCILQFWRCHVCNTGIRLKADVAEFFRESLRHAEGCDDALLKQFPISVSYVKRKKEIGERNHYVGFTDSNNPFVVFLNNFVFQLFDSMEVVKYDSLYGINQEENYKEYINFNETHFKVKIIQPIEWEQISMEYYKKEKLPLLEKIYMKSYSIIFDDQPSKSEYQSFLDYYERNRKTMPFTTDEMIRWICCYYRNKYGFEYE